MRTMMALLLLCQALARADGTPRVPRGLRLYVALYEDDVTVAVTRGENAGRTLHADRVVRAWLGPQGDGELTRDVVLAKGWARAQLGWVGFVEDAATGEVLQAV